MSHSDTRPTIRPAKRPAERPTEEGVTFFGHKPSDVLEAFHASGLSALGFTIAGRIVPNTARLVGQTDSLFGDQKMYAATFLRGPLPA